MIHDLISYLLSKSSITAIVGQQIRPDTLAQSDDKTEVPTGIMVESTAQKRYPHLAGPGGLIDETFEIHCQSPRRTATKSLAEAVRLVVDGYTGAMGSTAVLNSTIDDSADDYEAPYDGESTGTFETTLTVTITYRETIPVYS